MLDYEEGDTVEEDYFNSCYFQDQDHHLYQGKPSKMLAVTNTYHYLSCMFLLLKFYKLCLNKTIFDVAIITMHNIRINIMSIVETWCYQAHSHHMV